MRVAWLVCSERGSNKRKYEMWLSVWYVHGYVIYSIKYSNLSNVDIQST